ncbi:PDDEXK nuclease domain-containing protein [Autumnicola edwardsiae]|uniref:PDDEXK nuclease domain-containing protein n=1 Tax=Autumnicola edwardsiae TaxID=3075594 RepID=A0ABU3CYY3_9FLAO|nr:PDDEXK nuclease domain-containing protein [Zunongwangia sp. F297]MDT0651463.1 PDDEXK nuclease domain-containing protein [Zunongwangia sp. F297]
MSENNLHKSLISELSHLIEQGKQKVAVQVNSTMTMVFWQVGKRINEEILENERAEYGKNIVPTVSSQLKKRYGDSFGTRNLRRMMQFADIYPDLQIIVPLTRQLSWSHFVELFPIKNKEAQTFYVNKIAEERWSVRETRKQIERKAFERKEIANSQLPAAKSEMQHSFKDPYFFDFLGLKEGYLENDLEAAILKELEYFILELGKGFAFVERQKRMIIDGDDFYLDLLFYHRKLKRLVAIELKIGKFKAAYKGQMELYLRWLNKYEKQEGEEFPIGLILCAEASSEQIELLGMQKDGIMVAEYWTELPPKKELEQKIHNALIAARERIARKKLK